MKKISKYLLIAILISVMISCEKGFKPDGGFIGTWKILTPDSDILTFKNESLFTRKFYDGIDHSFKYSYDQDSITIQYSGPNKILIQPSTHHYELKNNELLIDFTNGCYGFESEKYNLIKIK
jgi:hypothetical protein